MERGVSRRLWGIVAASECAAAKNKRRGGLNGASTGGRGIEAGPTPGDNRRRAVVVPNPGRLVNAAFQVSTGRRLDEAGMRERRLPIG